MLNIRKKKSLKPPKTTTSVLLCEYNKIEKLRGKVTGISGSTGGSVKLQTCNTDASTSIIFTDTRTHTMKKKNTVFLKSQAQVLPFAETERN